MSEALKYLNVREAVLGGYDTKEVTFYPQDTPRLSNFLTEKTETWSWGSSRF